METETPRGPAEKTNDLSWFWDKLDVYLKSQDLKQTRQRRLIIDYFIKLDSHVDAETLHGAIRESGHNIGLATIYRTLNLLKEARLVEQQSFADGRAVFELDKPGNHHDHLVCVDCGTIVEFENEVIETIQRQIAADHGFKLASHRLDLYGHCSKESCSGRA